jgi:hypothetical protein
MKKATPYKGWPDEKKASPAGTGLDVTPDWVSRAVPY